MRSSIPFVTGGLVDAHTHLRSTSYRDQGIGGSIFEEAILRMSAMTSVPVEDDVFVACVDLLEKGVTTVQVIFHTFGDPDDYREALHATMEGISRSGIRALVVLATTDQAEFLPVGVEDPGLPEFCRVKRRLSPEEFADVTARARADFPGASLGVGPVGPQWCSDSLLGALGEIASEGYRVHSHFLESLAQRSWAPGEVLERMRKHGLLGPQTSLAHAVWCTPEELSILADLGVQLVTCPHSNALLKAGRAPVDTWRSAGITVGVGLDSADNSKPPIEVARLVLSEEDALTALTEGGQHCTEFTNIQDSVTWSNFDRGEADSVQVDGRTLVSGGRFHDASAVEGIREAIRHALTSDSLARSVRHERLDEIMPEYLQRIAGGAR